MVARPRVYLDISALLAGIWPSAGGGRLILRLGEAGAIRLWVSPQVLDEIERALRRKAPDLLGLLVLLLDRSGIGTVAAPEEQLVTRCAALTGHSGAAQVVAAAWAAAVDYFVTLDHQHFLDNAELRSAVPFAVGTPGDFVAWYRRAMLDRWMARDR